MNKKDLERSALERAKDVERLYEEYGIEIEKMDFSKTILPFYDMFAKKEEAKTIKLSNSTTPLACY